MAEIGEDHLLQLLGLAGDGCGDGRLPVAMEGDPPTTNGVDQGAPIGQFQLAAPGPAHLQRWRAGAHLGGGMPEVGMPVQALIVGRQRCDRTGADWLATLERLPYRSAALSRS